MKSDHILRLGRLRRRKMEGVELNVRESDVFSLRARVLTVEGSRQQSQVTLLTKGSKANVLLSRE